MLIEGVPEVVFVAEELPCCRLNVRHDEDQEAAKVVGKVPMPAGSAILQTTFWQVAELYSSSIIILIILF